MTRARCFAFRATPGDVHLQLWLHDVAQYELVGTKAGFDWKNGYEYLGELKCVITVGDNETEETFNPEINSRQNDYFSDCILNDRSPEPSRQRRIGDVRVINAIYQSAKTGRAVRIEPVQKGKRPDREMGDQAPRQSKNPS